MTSSASTQSGSLQSLDRSRLLQVVETLSALRTRKRENRLTDYWPYQKQCEFHEAGATSRERLLMAGNQLGKTYSGAAEAAFHLTGRYPDWWTGRRFKRPIRAMAGTARPVSLGHRARRVVMARTVLTG